MKNQNFEKMKKTPRDIIILHLCTTNNNHMRYGSWYMKLDRPNFLSFWVIFYPFTQNTKNQNFEKMTKTLEETSFYTCVPQMTIIWYMVPEIWSMADRIISHFGPFFAFKPWELRKSKFWKNEKKGWISSFYISVPKIIGAPLKKTPR